MAFDDTLDDTVRTLCIFCGEDAPKLNLHDCPSCGGRPETVEDLAYAMAYNGLLYSDATLDKIASDLRRGRKRPKPPKKDFKELLDFAGSMDLDQILAPIRTKH